MDRKVEFVLHDGEEGLRGLRLRAVVHRRRVDVRDFLVKAAFAGPDGTDPLQQPQEVVLAEHLLALLQAFIIQHKALADIFLQNLSSPNAELGSTLGADAVADCNDGIEAIVLEGAPNGPPAFVLNYREILGSCLFRQFALCVDVPEV